MYPNKVKGEPLNILLVEDNMDHAELVMRSFRDFQVATRIVHVADGQEALDYLYQKAPYQDTEQYPVPNLILLDIRMPKIDGLAVLETIKNEESLRQIPVVILTTSETDKDIAKAYKHHVNSYLVKPLNFDDFSALMRDLGFYWLGWNQYPWQNN